MQNQPIAADPQLVPMPVAALPKRSMLRTELLGRHTHFTRSKQKVHIWIRNGKFLARGRHGGKQFGETLGENVNDAEVELIRLLVQLDEGAFLRPSQRRHRQISVGAPPQLTVRQACDAFLSEKRKLRGKQTVDNYRARLIPLIEFAELPANRPHWPLLESIDSKFAIEFRTFLNQRLTTRNGHAASTPKPMSASHIRNVLSCVSALLNWSKDIRNNRLATSFVNPFTRDIIGEKPSKDPLRNVVFPLEFRVRLVGQLDAWELSHFAIALTLPLRPEDYTGLLISEIDWVKHTFRFGPRFGGRDFNKGKQSFTIPFPPEIEPLLKFCAGSRSAGSLLQSRAVWSGQKTIRLPLTSHVELTAAFERVLAQSSKEEQQTAHDAKRQLRKLLVDCGGLSVNALSREFKQLLEKMSPTVSGRFYDLRGSVNTDLEQSGVSHLVQRYVTGHTTKDILYEYASLDPWTGMQKYFAAIQPLLNAIKQRAAELGIPGYESKEEAPF